MLSVCPILVEQFSTVRNLHSACGITSLNRWVKSCNFSAAMYIFFNCIWFSLNTITTYETSLRTRPTFSETVMVSVGVSKLGCTELFFFVEPGVKINGVYYHDVLLTQKLLPVIKQLSGNEFVFQQDSAPTHRARETIELLRRETRRTLFHWNSGHRTVHILTRWTTKYGLQCSSASTRQRFEMLTNCDSVCWTFGAAVMPVNKTSSTHPLTSGVCDSKHAYVREADILNAC